MKFDSNNPNARLFAIVRWKRRLENLDKRTQRAKRLVERIKQLDTDEVMKAAEARHAEEWHNQRYRAEAATEFLRQVSANPKTLDTTLISMD